MDAEEDTAADTKTVAVVEEDTVADTMIAEAEEEDMAVDTMIVVEAEEDMAAVAEEDTVEDTTKVRLAIWFTISLCLSLFSFLHSINPFWVFFLGGGGGYGGGGDRGGYGGRGGGGYDGGKY